MKYPYIIDRLFPAVYAVIRIVFHFENIQIRVKYIGEDREIHVWCEPKYRPTTDVDGRPTSSDVVSEVLFKIQDVQLVTKRHYCIVISPSLSMYCNIDGTIDWKNEEPVSTLGRLKLQSYFF